MRLCSLMPSAVKRMADMERVEGDYKCFNTEDFLKMRFPLLFDKSDFCHDIISEVILKGLAQHFTVRMANVDDGSLKILDYGCGPSLAYSISASLKASEIVLADYAQPNRDYLKKWLAKDPSVHDWSPCFKYVVQTLEGKSEAEAIQREELLRDKVKAVVHCDLNEDDEFVEKGFGGDASYDVVMSFLCLQSVCKDILSFKRGVKKITNLLKEGGYLLLCFIPKSGDPHLGSYVVNDKVYSSFKVDKDTIFEILKENDLVIAEMISGIFSEEKYGNPSGTEVLFISAVSTVRKSA